jgi:hypothetical protein
VVVPLALDHFLLNHFKSHQARPVEVRRWDYLALVQVDRSADSLQRAPGLVKTLVQSLNAVPEGSSWLLPTLPTGPFASQPQRYRSAALEREEQVGQRLPLNHEVQA